MIKLFIKINGFYIYIIKNKVCLKLRNALKFENFGEKVDGKTIFELY